ncbi:MAG: hypothetical protein E4G94_05690 [ANME-2 cluster archaeon]|nr:MAG: hypothetical protein E4G94_05690 [ANME-2 cluster archaeon]
MTADTQIEKLTDILGSNLVALVQYHTGDETRLLAVCNHIDFTTLQSIKPLKEVPLVMTKEELTDGVDVFPIEFLNIKQHYEVFHCEDCLADIKISKKHLRHQLEFEFRSKLIHLREEYLQFKGKDLEHLILAAVPAIMPILGGLIHLKDLRNDWTDTEELFRIVTDGYGIDTQVLEDIYSIRQKTSKMSKDKEQYIEHIIRILSDIGEIIDELEVNE